MKTGSIIQVGKVYKCIGAYQLYAFEWPFVSYYDAIEKGGKHSEEVKIFKNDILFLIDSSEWCTVFLHNKKLICLNTEQSFHLWFERLD